MYYFVDEELRNFVHFYLKSNGVSSLNETAGYSEEVLDFTRKFIPHTVKQINSTIDNKKEKSLVYNEVNSPISADSINFISGYSISIRTKYVPSEDDEFDNDSYFSGERSFITVSDDGEIKIYPVIEIYAYGFYNLPIIKQIYFKLGHELTHAYSIYRTLLRYKKEILSLCKKTKKNKFFVSDLIKRFDIKNLIYYAENRSRNISKDVNSIQKEINRFVYLTSEQEKHSVIAQIRNELDDYKGSLKTGNNITSAIKTTNAYEVLLDVIESGSTISSLLSNDDIKTVCPDILNIIKIETGKGFNKLSDTKLYFEKKTDEYREFFMRAAGKLAASITIKDNIKNESFVFGNTRMEFLDNIFRRILRKNK